MNTDLLIYTSDLACAQFIASLLTLQAVPYRVDMDVRRAHGFTVRNLPINVAGEIKQTIERFTAASVTEI